MSESFDIDHVDRITAGAVGAPGERSFYVQVQAAGAVVTLLAEKEQVRLLAEALLQLLGTLPEVDEGPPPDGQELELESPLEPEWRVGEIAIDHDGSGESVDLDRRVRLLGPRRKSKQSEGSGESVCAFHCSSDDLGDLKLVCTNRFVD